MIDRIVHAIFSEIRLILVGITAVLNIWGMYLVFRYFGGRRVYVWVHYHCTELPDMVVIYGDPA